MEQNHLKKLILLILLTKFCIFFTIILGFYFLPFASSAYFANFTYPKNAPISLATPFMTWDAQHYIFLAEKGYTPNQMSNVFFPLFPFLIKIFKVFFLNNALITGLVLSNLFSLAAVIFFYLFVKKLFKEEIAFVSSLFFLAFPTSFYLSLIYSESLFLMLTLLFFSFLYQDKFFPALFASFLLPLTKFQGILLLIPLVVFLLSQKSRTLKLWFLPLGLAAGFFTYLIFMQLSTGNFFSGFSAQKYFLADNSIANLFHLGDWFMRNFVNLSFRLHGFTTSLTDRSFFVFFLFLLYFIYKKFDRTLFCYALVFGLLPALMGNFMAYTRYLLLVFPLFIILALLLKEKHYYISLPLTVLQVLFLLVHSLNFWIA